MTQSCSFVHVWERTACSWLLQCLLMFYYFLLLIWNLCLFSDVFLGINAKPNHVISPTVQTCISFSRLLYSLMFGFHFFFALRCQPKVSVGFGLIGFFNFSRWICTGLSCLAVSFPLVCLPSGVCLRLLLLVNGWISKRQVCRSVSLSSVIQSPLLAWRLLLFCLCS